jgi:SsrA-binding protein
MYKEYIIYNMKGKSADRMPIKRGIKPLAQNRKARHDYFIEDSLECGIELCGTEVKSLRKGQCNLKDSYAQVKNGELFVIGMHISPYEQGNIYNRDPFPHAKTPGAQERNQKVGCQFTAGRHEPDSVADLSQGRPRKNGNRGCKGKKLYDKRHSIAERTPGARWNDA